MTYRKLNADVTGTGNVRIWLLGGVKFKPAGGVSRTAVSER